MKYTVIIDKNREEEVVVYLREPSEIADKIERLVMSENAELIGYGEGRIIPLAHGEIYAVYIEDGKLYASAEKEKLRLYERLYELEEKLGDGFVKINQSCIVNIKKIERFEVSAGGSLIVWMKNGYKDYVSRRQLKIVKERIGFRL
jgi:DNA-binding LytR/AlgR family response regulator